MIIKSQMKFHVTRQEEYIFSFLVLFAVVWVIGITPMLENSSYFSKLNPVIQYVSFNLGFIFLTVVLINLPYRIVTKTKVSLKNMLKLGIVGWLLFSFIYDLWQPPNYLSPSGHVLIVNQQALPNTAVDAMLTYLWSFVVPNGMMIHGISLLYISVYFFTPIITVSVMILLFRPNIIKQAILEK